MKDKTVWSGMAKDNCYGSWHNIEVIRDDAGLFTLYDDGEYDDSIYSLEDMFYEYVEFADAVVPVGIVSQEDIMKMWVDSKE